MGVENGPAGPNILVLQQGRDLILRLDDDLYRPVGMQFRHCLDFYGCLLAGRDQGEVDYECRTRDDRIAEDRRFALERINALIEELHDLDQNAGALPLRARGEAPAGAPRDGAPWASSSLLRELQFLFSHTMHHYAIIRLLLAARGFETGEEFGVAPSTLRYWEKQTGHPAV